MAGRRRGSELPRPRARSPPPPRAPGSRASRCLPRRALGLERRVRVVEVGEGDAQPGRFHERREEVHRVGDQGVADRRHVAPRQLVEGVEGAVEERLVDAGEQLRQRPRPGAPGVGVRHVEDGAPRAADEEAEGVAVLVAVRHLERRHRHPVLQRHRLAGAQRAQLDVLQLHELAPGAVAAQEVGHARRGPDREAPGVDRLEAEEGEPEVVADVGVGQEDAVDRGAVDAPRGGAPAHPRHLIELLAEVGRGVEQVDLVARRQVQGEARDVPAEARLPPRPLAAHAGAGDVRQAAVLHRAERHQPRRGRGGRRCSGRRRRPAQPGGGRERHGRKDRRAFHVIEA